MINLLCTSGAIYRHSPAPWFQSSPKTRGGSCDDVTRLVTLCCSTGKFEKNESVSFSLEKRNSHTKETMGLLDQSKD
jgi:hypothetical protein